MNADEMRSRAREVYDAINRFDVAGLEALFAPGIIRHAAREVGFEHARNAVLKIASSETPPRFEVVQVLAEGDTAALRVLVHRGPPAPGEPTPLILEFFRFEDGRVAEIWGAGSQQMPPG